MSLPQVPPGIKDPNLANFLRQLRNSVAGLSEQVTRIVTRAGSGGGGGGGDGGGGNTPGPGPDTPGGSNPPPSGDGYPPPAPLSLAAAGGTQQVTLDWTNPIISDYATTEVWGKRVFAVWSATTTYPNQALVLGPAPSTTVYRSLKAANTAPVTDTSAWAGTTLAIMPTPVYLGESAGTPWTFAVFQGAALQQETWTFWVRNRDIENMTSPFFPADDAGITGSSTSLDNQIVNTGLWIDLGQRIDLIDQPGGLIDQTQTELQQAIDDLAGGVTDITVTTASGSSTLRGVKTSTETNSAAILAINEVSATSGSANARYLWGLNATVTDSSTGLSSKASVTQLNQAKADIYGSAVTSFTNISAKFDSQQGDINSRATVTQMNTAIATAKGEAIAESVQQVSARIGDSRPNLCPNGSLAAGLEGLTGALTGWGIIDGVWGRTAARYNPPNTAGSYIAFPSFPVAAGITYSVTGDALLVANAGGSGYCYFDLIFLDASNNPVKDGAQAPKNATFDFSDDTSRRAEFAVADTAPAGAVSAYVRFVWATTNCSVVGLRQVQVVRGGLPMPAFSNDKDAITVEQEVSVQASAISGLKAQWSVKIDNNGYVSGFGLSSEPAENGTPQSWFIVRADHFAIGEPATPRTGTCSIGGHTSKSACEAAGGVWTWNAPPAELIPFKVSGGKTYIKEGYLESGVIANYVCSSGFPVSGGQPVMSSTSGMAFNFQTGEAVLNNARVRGDVLLGGGNLIQNSEGIHGWTDVAGWNDGTWTGTAPIFAGSTDPANPYFAIGQGAGYNNSFALASFYKPGTNATGKFPVKGSGWYQFSADLQTTSATSYGNIIIDWYNGSTWLGNSLETQIGGWQAITIADIGKRRAVAFTFDLRNNDATPGLFWARIATSGAGASGTRNFYMNAALLPSDNGLRTISLTSSVYVPADTACSVSLYVGTLSIDTSNSWSDAATVQVSDPEIVVYTNKR